MQDYLNSVPLQAAQAVAVVEGEKDADALVRLGIPATCNPGGAGKWRDEHSQYFKGKDICIIPDNDGAGRDHARKVARSLYGIAKSVKILELPDLPPKGDVIDWLRAGGTAERLRELPAAAPAWEAGQEAGLSSVQVNNRQLRDSTAEAMAALGQANDPPRIFVQMGRLAQIEVDE